jgi:hypothetical protein
MMQSETTHFPVTPIALKMAVAVGMLAGMEREWSNKDVGVRTFAIVALLGMLASLIGPNVAIAASIGVFLLIASMNTRSILTDRSLEITTSAALMLNYPLRSSGRSGSHIHSRCRRDCHDHVSRLEDRTQPLRWWFAAF